MFQDEEMEDTEVEEQEVDQLRSRRPSENALRSSALRVSWTRGATALWQEYTQPVRQMSFNDNFFSTANFYRLLDNVEDTPFQVFMQTVIVLNVLVLWFETDYAHWSYWTLVDNIFLWIFIVELVLRITQKGPVQYLLGSHLSRDYLWNLLDLTIVVLGGLDLWVAPMFASPQDKAESGNEDADSDKSGAVTSPLGSTILRFLRMLRLLRLARVFKMVRPLTVFAEALGGMLAPVAWFLTMLFLFNFIFSIVLTDILKDDEDERVSENFSSIGETFFTLFQITTTDNWIQIAEPVIQKDWKWQFFFVAFIAFASWTMISILTAVACDNMINAMEDRLEKSRQEGERKLKEFIILLRKAFHESDKDGNGLLDTEELEELLDSHSLKMVFEQCDIQVQKDELKKRFEMLDVTGTGVLSIDEFVEGLGMYQEGLSTKHIVNLDYSVRRLALTFEGQIDKLENKVALLRKRSNALFDRLCKQNQVYLQQHMALQAWQEWALQNDPKAFPSEFLEKARQPPPWLPPVRDVDTFKVRPPRASDQILESISTVQGMLGGPRNAL